MNDHTTRHYYNILPLEIESASSPNIVRDCISHLLTLTPSSVFQSNYSTYEIRAGPTRYLRYRTGWMTLCTCIILRYNCTNLLDLIKLCRTTAVQVQKGTRTKFCKRHSSEIPWPHQYWALPPSTSLCNDDDDVCIPSLILIGGGIVLSNVTEAPNSNILWPTLQVRR